jgi:hypothetical protein
MYLDSNENLKAAVKYARRPKRPIRLAILFLEPRERRLKLQPLETDHNVPRGILLNKKSSLQPFLKEKLRSHPWEILLKDGRARGCRFCCPFSFGAALVSAKNGRFQINTIVWKRAYGNLNATLYAKLKLGSTT